MKPFLIAVGVLVLVGGGFYSYERIKTQKEINAKVENLSDEAKSNYENDVNNLNSIDTQIRQDAHQNGIPTFPKNEQEIDDAAASAEIAGSEAAIKGSMQQVPASAEIYFNKYGNYGTSNSENACENTDPASFTFVISLINKYSKTSAQCMISATYPAKTFTIIVPSLVNLDQYYCSDQNGFEGLISISNSQFGAGVKCK